jgi:hypothetical protein
MHVEIDNPSYTDDLAAFLRSCDCTVEVLRPGLLEVEPYELPISTELRKPDLELNSYPRTWSALQPAAATIVAPGRS